MKEIDKKAGIILRRFRNLRGYSQGELAEAVGVTFQQIQKYEKGNNRMSISMLFDICEFLKIKPTDFIDEVPVNKPVDEIDISYVKEFLAVLPAPRKKMLT